MKKAFSFLRFVRRKFLGVNSAEKQTITNDHVVWAYRLFLDRDPENEDVIKEKVAGWRSTRGLRNIFMSSEEFHLKNPDLAHINESSVVIKELEFGLRLFVDLSDQEVGLNIVRNRYEPLEVDFIKRTVQPGQTVIDLGAHAGFFTVIMAHLAGPSGMVYAYEPLKQNADLLERSLAENGFENRVSLTRAAVGNSRRQVRLTFNKRSINTGAAYVLDRSEALAGHDVIEVDMVRLDECEIRRPVSFMKVDIEGSEPLAFEGADKIIREDKPIIMSELNPILLGRVSGFDPLELVEYMNKLDYDYQILGYGKLSSKAILRLGDSSRTVVFTPKGKKV